MTTTSTTTTLSYLQLLLEESPHLTILAIVVLTGLFTIVALLLTAILLYKFSNRFSPAMLYHYDQRRRLPQTIVVIRHGESEANADHTKWQTVPDNLLGLTPKGRQQALAVGQRVEQVLIEANAHRVHLVISPFERTLQTAHHLRQSIEPRIVRTEIESRIREQEVGNLQGEEFQKYRQEQKKVGRFWYRFPTGESGADVLDRVKSWWQESVLTTNLRAGYEPVDALVVVTHGLTIRFILTQLFGWSPTTFHSVWNADNCAMYVLQKDLKFPGLSPYSLSTRSGDQPKSSIEVSVTLQTSGEQQHLLRLENYLGVPPPRTKQTKLIRRMLCKQHPNVIKSPKDIQEILFMPFMEGGIIRGRCMSGSTSTSRRMHHQESSIEAAENTEDHSSNSGDFSEDEDMVTDEIPEMGSPFVAQKGPAKREMSLRYPCCKTVLEMLQQDEDFKLE